MRTGFSLLIAFVMLSGSTAVRGAETNQTLTVHGRLSLCNGTPSFRIWIVGTKRMLGIDQSGNEVPSMPQALRDLIINGDNRSVFADFVIEPLTPYKQGVMQTVRVVSASKIVVTENDKIVLRKDKL
jgi:hypothetical protein